MADQAVNPIVFFDITLGGTFFPGHKSWYGFGVSSPVHHYDACFKLQFSKYD